MNIIIEADKTALGNIAALEGGLTPEVPASILQTHANCGLYLDAPAAALLSGK